jgi:hypothetical protein
MSTPTDDRWESYLLEDPGAADFVRDENREAGRRRAARDLEATLEHARVNGYDVDASGRYVAPEGES